MVENLISSPGSLISAFLPKLFEQKNVSDFSCYYFIIVVLIFNAGFGVALDWLP